MNVTTSRPDETRACAARIGALLEAGDVVVLAGEMGAGKTVFAQGLALGLGVTALVTSPTFGIVAEYEGRVLVAHVDAYRLERFQELHDLGFEELIDSDRVTIIEWGDLIARVLPAERLVVELAPGVAEDERHVGVAALGPRWHARLGPLAACLPAPGTA